jgi:6,7-dimethyl-8-ribityllumazine synthase
VIRGETTHYDLVAGEAAAGIQQVQLDSGVPVAFGILATEDEDQALARSDGAGGHNVGEDAAVVAVEMARLAQRLSPG